MVKTTKTFKISKQTKRMCAAIGVDAHERGAWRRMFIDAQVCAEEARKIKLKEKNLGEE